jgi:hypothetical protein
MTPEERAARAINAAHPNDPVNWITGESGLRLRDSISREITEAQAETVERCAEAAGCRNEYGYVMYEAIAKVVRSLSPDPHWLEGKLLDTRIEEAEFYSANYWMESDCFDGGVFARIAEFKHQREELGKKD